MPGSYDPYNPGNVPRRNRPRRPRGYQLSAAGYAMKYGKSARVVASRFLQKRSQARTLRRKHSAKKIQRAVRGFLNEPTRRTERRARKSKVTGYFTSRKRR